MRTARNTETSRPLRAGGRLLAQLRLRLHVYLQSAFLPLFLAACGGSVTTGPGGDDGPAREVSTLTVRVAEEDMAAAERLGWTGGAVPGVEVVLARETLTGQIADSAVATTDASGVAEFEDLIPATYRVTALRLLSEEEVGRVEDKFSTLRAFGGGMKTRAGGTPFDRDFTLQRNRTDGLVISEYSFTQPVIGQPGFGYAFGGYMEVYNNSDRVLALDGKIVIWGFFLGGRDFASRPCHTTRRGANDPDGVWGLFFEQFPGTSGEFTLAPGETAVIATDAIDHTQVADVFLDLTGADFEFNGSSDPDNPDVPDMVNIGLREWFRGHGLESSGAGHVPTLVEDVPIESLPRDRVDPAQDNLWVRFPAESVLDVYSVNSETSLEVAFCSEMVHDRFDRLDLLLPRGFQEPPGPRMSQQRRVVGTAPGGWPILLDTNTSAVDFVTTDRTPGTLPAQQ